MNDNGSSSQPAWFTRGVIGGGISIAAGLLGFLDYFVSTATQNVCIDVEEGVSDRYVASLALLGGILALSRRHTGGR